MSDTEDGEFPMVTLLVFSDKESYYVNDALLADEELFRWRGTSFREFENEIAEISKYSKRRVIWIIA